MWKKFLVDLKKKDINIPVAIGELIAQVPFSLRPGIGKIYKEQTENIYLFNQLQITEQKKFIFNRFFRVFEHAYNTIPFYYELYTRNNIKPESLRSFEDIQNVPIISKHDLLEVPLEYRSLQRQPDKRLVLNTGGSSGKTLSLYLDPNRFGNEWAHIHYIWSKLGYKPGLLKLSFDGRVNMNGPIKYDGLRHSLRLNIYANPQEVSRKLLPFIKKRPIFFLHGYPSAIYSFACYCREFDQELLITLRKHLKGVFLTSEFPSKHYRDTIEEVFSVPSQSFYGHTETCIIAYEEEPFLFQTLQSYGYAEVEKINNDNYLIGTNYFNFESPLIRYNTEDIVDEVGMESGVLKTFRITKGREGDFILDKNHIKISLTGLVFGRHHRIFNYCKHIQIKQEAPGTAIIYYVEGINPINEEEAYRYFDVSDVAIDFVFKSLKSPILSKSGKVNLLIK